MKNIKGCTNPSCRAKHFKRVYKENDLYCSECGEPLHYVCKNCWSPLVEGDTKFCQDCVQKKSEKREAVRHSAEKKIDLVKDVVIGVAPLAIQHKDELIKLCVKGASKAKKLKVKVI